MRALREGFDLVQVLECAHHSAHSKLGLQDLSFVGIADDSRDLEGFGIGVLYKARKDSASDVTFIREPWTRG